MEISPEKKMTETLHHALCAMMQFPVIFFSGDTAITKQKNKFIP
jgi:D-aminopeptidase